MKKAILVLVLAVLVSAPVMAATTFNWGIKAGLSYSKDAWSGDDGSAKPLFRPTFGVFAVIDLKPNLAIQPEVDYLITGDKWKDTFDSTTSTEVIAFSYLHIPVLVKYGFSQAGKIRPSVFAGPALGILLSAREKGYTNGGLDYDENIKDLFKSVDVGLDFGLGAEMAFGKMKGLLDLRYYLGLTNAYQPPTMLMSIVDFSMKNRALIFTVGLIF